MNKTGKRLLSAMLAVLMVLSVCLTSYAAADGVYTEADAFEISRDASEEGTEAAADQAESEDIRPFRTLDEAPAAEEIEAVSEILEEPEDAETAGTALEAGSAEIFGASGTTYLAFTTDVHGDTSALGSWLDTVGKKIDGKFDVVGVCGDLSEPNNYSAGDTKAAVDVINSRSCVVSSDNSEKYFMVVGNHDISGVKYDYLLKNGTVKKSSDYVLYALGVGDARQQESYSDSDLTALENYFKNADKKLPVFILIHVPVSAYGGASENETNGMHDGHPAIGSARMISILNEASSRGYRIFLLWGHNHTNNDEHYDKFYTEKIGSKDIGFVYCSAGAMVSNRRGSGVKARGLVAAITGDEIELTYYDLDGNVINSLITHGSGDPDDPDEPTYYTVTWKNDDGTVLGRDQVEKGKVPSYQGTPTKASTQSYDYTFAGWTPQIAAATKDVTYTATYTAVKKPATYEIRWQNNDGTLLKKESVKEGVVPRYTGNTPSKASTPQYDYTFAGWTPTVEAAKADAVYTAVYSSSYRKYTVTWRNYDRTVIVTSQVAYGDTPVYPAADPERPEDDQYTYRFNGWTPAVGTVTGDVTYTAQFTAVKKEVYYNITWKNYDGTTLETDRLKAGEMPEYKGPVPERKADERFIYSFAGWDRTIVPAAKDTSYTAVYTAERRDGNVTVTELTNNQSIVIAFSAVNEGADEKKNYSVTNSAGDLMEISAVNREGENTCRINFAAPLKAGTYTLSVKGLSYDAETAFVMELDISVYEICDSRNIILQLSSPIVGCNVASNYYLYPLGQYDSPIGISAAQSAFEETGATPNTFKLTLDQELKDGQTYVVETRNMRRWVNDEEGGEVGNICQGTIAYFTPEIKAAIEVYALTNNQSIIMRYAQKTERMYDKTAYTVKNTKGETMKVGEVKDASGETGTANTVKINFADPLDVDTYTVQTSRASGSFRITLKLSYVNVPDKNSVIIRLSSPIVGCTEAENYTVRNISTGEEYVPVSAESAYLETGEIPNTFKLTFAKRLTKGIYQIETKNMFRWKDDIEGGQPGEPCQGTMAYIPVD